MTAVIDATNLMKVFGDVVAVDNVSLRIDEGQTVALLGGNGAGKTTTISMLLGLLLPTTGQVRILGHDLRTERYKVLARMNFSSPYVELPHRLTVAQNLRVYADLYGVRAPAERIKELTENLDLTAYLDRPSGKLSAGQKTRLALAKSLINRPAVLLLDEPTASLDPDTGDWVRAYLERYRRETNATMLIASHNMAEVERLCDEVLMMRAGRIVDQGAPGDLLARYGRQTLEDVFLDIARERRETKDLTADDQAEGAVNGAARTDEH
ncbi:ABC transporter ATP-binding protein [Alphaproteobacteria bacterium]|nr:ABC transporter ATP-binding protein [Alphaproteobacteria bacterium]